MRVLRIGAVVLACASVAAWNQGDTPALAHLGTEALCGAGTGLPAGWGTEPRAGMVPLPAGSGLRRDGRTRQCGQHDLDEIHRHPPRTGIEPAGIDLDIAPG